MSSSDEHAEKGYEAPTDARSDQMLSALLAESAIRRVLYRYARGIDRMDMAMVRSCYHAGAWDDHGAFSGPVEEFIRWVETSANKPISAYHHIGNILIELGGPFAKSEAYCTAVHRQKEADGSLQDFILDVRFLDNFELRNGEWRIIHRQVVFENSGRCVPVPLGDPHQHPGTMSVYGPDDISVRWFANGQSATIQPK
jgi:hypothetical protein